eukprot:scaffold36562_cov38-Phaeocystis_antarctica.AAC.1
MDGRANSIQQQKLQGTPQVYKRVVPSAHGRKGANRFNNKSCRAPLRCKSEECPAHMDGRERNRFNNKSCRAPLRCTSEGCPAHMDGREQISSQKKPQGTPHMYKRGVPSAHGRKGANQFTIIAPGHPSGVQARGAQRTWTERSESIQQQKLQGTPQ